MGPLSQDESEEIRMMNKKKYLRAVK